jgi:predicted small metal-binding protein
MKNKSFVSLLAAAFLASAASYLFAADSKPAMPSGVMGPLYTVQCDPKCDFGVHGHDKQEIIDIVIQHAKKHHNMEMKPADVEKIMTVTPPKM